MSTVVQDVKQLVVPPVQGRATGMVVERGEGSWFYTADGEKWLDMVMGIAVVNTGHGHPKVLAAAREQMEKLVQGQMALFYTQPPMKLADKLCEIVPGDMDRVLYTNSGAESVENAVKLAKQVTHRPAVIAFQGAFHGRTHYAMALTCSKTVYRGHFEPLPGGIFHSQYVYPYRTPRGEDPTDYALMHLDLVLRGQIPPDDVAAIIVEPIQGEGGYVVPTAEFIQALRKKADEIGALLIMDEIQTGMGRTGRWFCSEYFDVVPDIVTVAKGIASGFPLGAVVSRSDIYDKHTPGSLGGTFGGNMVSCAAGVATIAAMRDEGMVDNAFRQGEKLRAALRELQKDYPQMGEVRGLGLMDAVEFIVPDTNKEPDAAFAKRVIGGCIERKMLILGCGCYDNCVRFIPALNVSDADLDTAIAIFTDAVKAAAAS
ncbi:MAG TPA: aminotransferase class III-fold pyridoxal phosphate-dependent enzyme [Thermoleophilia bacterium]|nr:aminotransferase class III-fold pyridoxal phosphate-dependent enzyme [Thermoleophilia bacterium]